MYNIITIDQKDSGIPEDGFGVINGRLFIAISKNGFHQYKESLIFIFHQDKILVKRSKVKIIQEFKVSSLEEIETQDSNIKSIIELIKEKYINFDKRLITNKKQRFTLVRVLTVLLRTLYQSLSKYFKMNYMNLKKRGFSYVLDTTYKDYFIKI
jgi:hypothetical protein